MISKDPFIFEGLLEFWALKKILFVQIFHFKQIRDVFLKKEKINLGRIKIKTKFLFD